MSTIMEKLDQEHGTNSLFFMSAFLPQKFYANISIFLLTLR